MMQLKIYDAAVITHGGVIMGLLAMFGYPKRKPLDWQGEETEKAIPH